MDVPTMSVFKSVLSQTWVSMPRSCQPSRLVNTAFCLFSHLSLCSCSTLTSVDLIWLYQIWTECWTSSYCRKMHSHTFNDWQTLFQHVSSSLRNNIYFLIGDHLVIPQAVPFCCESNPNLSLFPSVSVISVQSDFSHMKSFPLLLFHLLTELLPLSLNICGLVLPSLPSRSDLWWR